jgi:hypothetical protein
MKNTIYIYHSFKNIFIFCLLIISGGKALAQQLPNNNFCGDSGFESGVINMNDFRYAYGNYYDSFLTPTFDNNLFLTPPPTPVSWTAPQPIWNTSGSYRKWYEEITTPTGTPKEDFNAPLNVNASDSNPFADRPHEQYHHRIESIGDDPVIGSSLQKVHSGNYSFRLGNAAVIRGAELIQKTFVVTPATSNLSFWYAVVMGNPCLAGENCAQGITPHVLGGIPSFMVKVKNNTDNTFHNNLVNLSNNQYYIDNTNPFLTETFTFTRNNVTSTHSESIKYMPWSFVSVDLSSLMGKQITMYFITFDCTAAGHYAYAYLDDFCTAATSDNPTGSIEIDMDKTDDCGEGQICVNYSLPLLSNGSTGNTNLFLDIYQNGNLISTLNSGVLNSGDNYCFNINSTLLNNLNSTTGFFDYVVRGDFSINNVTLPSQILGIAGYGQNTNQNDDYKIECVSTPTPPCCDIPDLQIKFINRTNIGGGIFLNISGITTPIQNIEVSMLDYHVEYGNDLCKPTNMGIFGNISSPNNSLGGLALTDNGTQSISWNPGTPNAFNGNINLNISKPNILNLPCCDGKMSFCLKVKITDVNCNVCEKIVCGSLDLKDKTLQQHDPRDVPVGLDPSNPIETPIPIDIKDLPNTGGFHFNEVTNPKTGKTWMDRNLGASQVATSPTDSLAYGDLYQWGRLTDGHEKRTSSTTTTLSSSDVPGHGDFIPFANHPFDWRSPQNNNLWQGVNGLNNPCPSGYRLPTEAELNAERLSWTTNDATGAFSSPLKWTVAGYRYYSNGVLLGVGVDGFYRSSTTYGGSALSLYFNGNLAKIDLNARAYGMAVRCIRN